VYIKKKKRGWGGVLSKIGKEKGSLRKRPKIQYLKAAPLVEKKREARRKSGGGTLSSSP